MKQIASENAGLFKNAFIRALEIQPEDFDESMEYQGIPQWDSISHMILIDELETTFNIEFDPDHILMVNSVPKAKEILRLYDVHIAG